MTSTFLTQRLVAAGRTLLVVSVFAASLAPAQAETASTDGDIAARNEAIVREAFDRWQAGGNVFAELLAPDVIWTIHGSGPVADTYRGVEDFVERAAAPLVSRLAGPLTPEVHDVWAIDDRVIVRFDASGTTTSGNPYNNQFVWILRMEDGSVVEAEAFLDLVAYQEVVEGNEPREP